MLKKVGALAAIAAAVAVVVADDARRHGFGQAAARTRRCARRPDSASPARSPAARRSSATDQSNWVKLFIKNWNAGKAIPGVPKSLHRVKLNLALEGDSQLNPQVAATVARQMVANKKILGMVGFAGSNENLGGGPVLDAANLAYVSGSATLDTLATGTQRAEAADGLLPRRPAERVSRRRPASRTSSRRSS